MSGFGGRSVTFLSRDLPCTICTPPPPPPPPPTRLCPAVRDVGGLMLPERSGKLDVTGQHYPVTRR